jgi:L-aspartate oxidase
MIVNRRIRTILSRYAGIRRGGAGRNTAADELDTVGIGPFATVARAVVAVTARQDSRARHWRSDHPHADGRWDKQQSQATSRSLRRSPVTA